MARDRRNIRIALKMPPAGVFVYSKLLTANGMKVLVPQCFQSLPGKTFCATKNLGRASSERQALNLSANRAGGGAATPGTQKAATPMRLGWRQEDGLWQ